MIGPLSGPYFSVGQFVFSVVKLMKRTSYFCAQIYGPRASRLGYKSDWNKLDLSLITVRSSNSISKEYVYYDKSDMHSG